jgi:hypothetical protein
MSVKPVPPEPPKSRILDESFDSSGLFAVVVGVALVFTAALFAR